LVQVDTTTGQATLIGFLGVDGEVLYATSNNAAANLYTANTSTGAATLVGSVGVNMPSLAYDPATATLYGVSGQTDSLYTINTAAGATTQVGSIGTNTAWCGLAFDGATGQQFLSDGSGDTLDVHIGIFDPCLQ